MYTILLIILYFSNYQVHACSTGWFGSNCQYLCHCDSSGSCDVNGQCTTKCASGWFGLNCQYQDLATLPWTTLSKTPVQTTPTWLTDGDDATCNVDENIQSVKISWNNVFPFTWIRVKVKDPMSTLLFRMHVRTANNESVSCNGLVTLLDTTTADYRCDLNETIQELTVTGIGLKSLCSLYFSGGRNVALKQQASQTTTYTTSAASLAVDGNTDGNYRDGYTCSHTGEIDNNPSWTLALATAQSIQRFILYNRINNPNIVRLKYFKLETFDSSNNMVWSYQDTREALAIYTVTIFRADNISSLRISPTYKQSGDKSAILTLCEVELYGECASGLWGVGCGQECPLNCSSWCHKDTGQCPFCLGYSNPPLCTLECLEGYHGLSCQNKCSSHCYNSSCSRMTGVCDKGCLGYSNPPDCNIMCSQSYHGFNCQNNCSSNCYNNSCDRLTGVCDKGCLGYSNPPACNISCHTGHWGNNCENNCSGNCYGKSCDKLKGICDKGCDGYSNPPECNIACNGVWGPNCQFTCRSNCYNSSCDKVTGICNQGCNGNTDPPDCIVALKDNSQMTFQEGIGVGFAACTACVIAVCVVVLIVVSKRRKNQRKPQGGQKDVNYQETNLQSYDGVKQINFYQHSYESTNKSNQTNLSKAGTDNTSHEMSPQYENSPSTIYETIESNVNTV